MLTDRQRDRTPGPVDLLGELHTRRRRTHDEHATIAQLIGPAVLVGCEHRDAARHPIGDRRDDRHIARTRRQHHGPASPRTLVGLDHVAVVVSTKRRHRRLGLHRGAVDPRVVVDELDDLGHRHVPVEVITVIGMAGEAALAVRREQPERVPALGPPRVRDLTAFEDHMVDRVLRETAAHGKTAVTGSDHDGRGVHLGSLPCSSPTRQLTSTVTFVGLVMMS